MRGHQRDRTPCGRGARAARRAAPAAIVAAAMMLLAGCGGGDDPRMGGGPQTDGQDAEGQQADGQEADDATTVTGALAGDPDLEGGCAWLETDEGSVEVLWPAGYRVSFGPLQLHGPDGEPVAGDGEEITVRGEFAEDQVSVCQVGDLFDASAVLE